MDKNFMEIEKIDYNKTITVGNFSKREVSRLLLRKNRQGYGYDLIDRTEDNRRWSTLFYAQTEELCELGEKQKKRKL